MADFSAFYPAGNNTVSSVGAVNTTKAEQDRVREIRRREILDSYPKTFIGAPSDRPKTPYSEYQDQVRQTLQQLAERSPSNPDYVLGQQLNPILVAPGMALGGAASVPASLGSTFVQAGLGSAVAGGAAYLAEHGSDTTRAATGLGMLAATILPAVLGGGADESRLARQNQRVLGEVLKTPAGREKFGQLYEAYKDWKAGKVIDQAVNKRTGQVDPSQLSTSLELPGLDDFLGSSTDSRLPSRAAPQGDVLSRQIAGPVPRQIAGPVPRQIAGPVPRQIAGPVPRQIAGPVPRQIAGPVPRQIGYEVPEFVATGASPESLADRISISPNEFRQVSKTPNSKFNVIPADYELLSRVTTAILRYNQAPSQLRRNDVQAALTVDGIKGYGFISAVDPTEVLDWMDEFPDGDPVIVGPGAQGALRRAYRLMASPKVYLPRAVVEGVLDYPGLPSLKRAVVARRDFPRDLHEKVLQGDSTEALDVLMRRADFDPSATIATLAGPDASRSLKLAALRAHKLVGKIPIEVLERMADDSSSAVRYNLANYSGSLPESTVRKLASDVDESVKFSIAKRRDAPSDVLETLVKNGNQYVVSAALGNPATPSDIVNQVGKRLFALAPSEASSPDVQRLSKSLVFNRSLSNDLRRYLVHNVSMDDKDSIWFLRTFQTSDPDACAELILKSVDEDPDLLGGRKPTEGLKWVNRQAGLLFRSMQPDLSPSGKPRVHKVKEETAQSRIQFFDTLVKGLEQRMSANPGSLAQNSVAHRAAALLGSFAATPLAKAIGRPEAATKWVEPFVSRIRQTINNDKPVSRETLKAHLDDVRSGTASNMDDILFDKDLTIGTQDLRDLTAAALKSNRRIRESTGGEIRPGDASSKLGWFRDDDVSNLVRPTMQTIGPDDPPVVMWLHPGTGKSTRTATDGNLIDFDAVRHQELRPLLARRGYTGYGEKGPHGEEFDRDAWRAAHPGVLEDAADTILDQIIADPAARGHIIVTSALSHLRDRADQLSLVVDIPKEVSVPRIVRRDGMPVEKASAWKDKVDSAIAEYRKVHPDRYFSTTEFMEDLYADPGFEEALKAARVPVVITDTGVLGTGGMFLSGTAGDLAYTTERPSFNARWAHGNHQYAARSFLSLSEMQKRGIASLHNSDAGTGALKWALPPEIVQRASELRGRYPVHSQRHKNRTTTDDNALATLSTIRPDDISYIIDRLPGVRESRLYKSDDAQQIVSNLLRLDLADDPLIYLADIGTRHSSLLHPRRHPYYISPISTRANEVNQSLYLLDNLIHLRARSGVSNPPLYLTDVDRFKAAVAVRRLGDLTHALPEGFKYEADVQYDRRSRSLPNTEFKGLTLRPEDWRAALDVILVPDSYMGSPAQKFLSRRYPDLQLRTFSGASSDFSEKSGEAMMETREAAKGGDNFALSRNFLATDEVPETIFGIPVVQSGYSEADAAFFRDNPKAAGFYDLGGGDEETQGAEKGGRSRRDFAMSFEQPLDLRTIDGVKYVYPKPDNDGQITAGGYRYFVGQSDGVLKPHTNTNRMTWDQWSKAADLADVAFTARADKTTTAWGVRNNGAVADVLWDLAFNMGMSGYDSTMSDKGSPNLTARRARYTKAYGAETGATAALLSEILTYGKNRNRSLARADLLLDELRASEVGGKLAAEFDKGYNSVERNPKLTADDMRYSRYKAGIAALTNLLDAKEGN